MVKPHTEPLAGIGKSGYYCFYKFYGFDWFFWDLLVFEDFTVFLDLTGFLGWLFISFPVSLHPPLGTCKRIVVKASHLGLLAPLQIKVI